MNDRLVLDGAWGEGGGQILRTALALSVITGRPFRLERIRARRRRPGLAAQHLSAVRALGALCGARMLGDTLGSPTLEFTPRGRTRPGDYTIDVADARPEGSAGASTLVLQAMLLPLALASGRSTLILRGGTHVPFSPSFDYVRDVYLPILAETGVVARVELRRLGWYPAGGGELHVAIEGGVQRLKAIEGRDRGELLWVHGRVVTSRLPDHVGERMAEHARGLLAASDLVPDIEIERVDAACPGAGIFLVTEFARARAGFDALGGPGRPAEIVAEAAVHALLRHLRSDAAFDVHFADQSLLPAAFAEQSSELTIERVTGHLATNAWVLERFGVARIDYRRRDEAPLLVSITPIEAQQRAQLAPKTRSRSAMMRR
jgi:RNA 3'-terminal phosphate cyclase (ATP)